MGLIGLGRIGMRQMECAADLTGVQVIAVADPNAVMRFPGESSPRRYVDWREMLRCEDLDAVSICVPHHLHHPIAQASLESGRHVLIEKPLALNAVEARDLVALADKRHRVLMVEMTHRFYPPVVQAAKMIRDGRLGDIYSVEDRIIEPTGEHIHGWLIRRADAGGGVALTNGVHMLDRIAFVTGQSLHFHHGVAGYTAKLGDIEDAASMLLSLDNGAPVQLLAAWPRGNAGCDDELTIYGTRGTLRIWAWRGWRLEPIRSNESAEQEECYDPSASADERVRIALRLAMAEFQAAVRDGRMPDPPAVAALAAQELIEQYYRHAKRAGGST